MPELSITTWLRELEQAQARQGDEGMTLREMIAAIGQDPASKHQRAKMRDTLARMQAIGRLRVGQAIRKDISGVRRRFPVYRILPPPGKGATDGEAQR